MANQGEVESNTNSETLSKRRITAERQMQNRLNQRALRERKRNQMNFMEAELESAQAELAAKSQRIQQLEAEVARLGSLARQHSMGDFNSLSDKATLGPSPIIFPELDCESCTKLTHRNQFLERQLAGFHKHHQKLFHLSQIHQSGEPLDFRDGNSEGTTDQSSHQPSNNSRNELLQLLEPAKTLLEKIPTFQSDSRLRDQFVSQFAVQLYSFWSFRLAWTSLIFEYLYYKRIVS
ncbi:hypothetical protein BDR26DRAFT_852745 [Obelidium mucronatum]|nr:hypothetical protein BDR26DRAFT_852745 [Obelidium mucronatum]